MQKISQHKNWTCMKCRNNEFETDQIAATGKGLSKIFDIQNRRFTTVTCTRCKFTEMYKVETNSLFNALDFFTQ